jgi:hypothetical protein
MRWSVLQGERQLDRALVDDHVEKPPAHTHRHPPSPRIQIQFALLFFYMSRAPSIAGVSFYPKIFVFSYLNSFPQPPRALILNDAEPVGLHVVRFL